MDVLSHRVLRKSSMSPAGSGRTKWQIQRKARRGRTVSPVSSPQDLGWMEALRQTEWVLWKASRAEGGPGMPTSRRRPPDPSSQAGRGTGPDRGCSTEVVEEGSHAVAGRGSCRSWDGEAHPRTTEGYRF